MDGTKKSGIVTFIVLLFIGLIAAPKIPAATITVDCNKRGAVGPILSRLKPGDVVLVQGTCQTGAATREVQSVIANMIFRMNLFTTKGARLRARSRKAVTREEVSSGIGTHETRA